MTQAFRSFVIFAEMRTGSNLLEATLNAIKGVTCFGEAFNPYMMGWPDKDELQGVTRDEREADPLMLYRKLTDRPGHMPGFRYFHDHDPRVFDTIIEDRHCAKIVLTRNPLDSYVSTRLAWATNQWKLNETETPIPAAVAYDGSEFREMSTAIERFQRRVMHRLQVSGQAAFWLGYEDLRDAEVMTGLMHWLGRSDLARVEPARDQVPQNPREMAEKVENFDQMKEDLKQLDPFMLRRIPNFEPRRGPSVPGFTAAEAGRGLLFMPVQAGPGGVAEWLAQLGEVQTGFTQSTLRQWKRKHPGHRSFTILRHPLLRAWAAFDRLLAEAPPELRRLLREVHRVPLPEDEALAALPEDRRAELFAPFLDFLRRNLNAQTTLPTQAAWASQSEVVAGFARFVAPDMILREDRLAEDLPALLSAAGIDPAEAAKAPPPLPLPAPLRDKALRQAAKQAYLRDYIAFGFDD